MKSFQTLGSPIHRLADQPRQLLIFFVSHADSNKPSFVQIIITKTVLTFFFGSACR